MTTQTRQRRMGRRPGGESSRSAILDAAAELFARDGYGAATLRAIAAEAGVDSALLVKFYGTKEGLFSAVMERLGENLPDLLSVLSTAPPAERGRLLAETYFGLWEDERTSLVAQALVRGAIGSPSATGIMQAFLEANLFREAPGVDIAAVTALLIGVAVTRYVIRVGPLAEMPVEDLIALIAPSLQAQLDRH